MVERIESNFNSIEDFKELVENNIIRDEKTMELKSENESPSTILSGGVLIFFL
jgi:hypothetical protein